MSSLYRLHDLAEKAPKASKREALEALARTDPLIWSMLYRRLRGHPATYDSMADIKAAEAAGITGKSMLAILLRHRPFLIDPLCDTHPHKVYKKGRQVGVSELSVAEALQLCDTHKLKWVYTFPRDAQLKDFSNTRIKEVRNESAYMANLFSDTDQVYLKRVGPLGSFLFFRSAWDANLGEGIDADAVTFDEKDRMREGVETAFQQSLKSSVYGLVREVSTPTIPNRGVDASFQRSDQRCWFVRCVKCKTPQEVRYPENVVQMKDIKPGATELEPGTYEYRCYKTTCRGLLDRLSGEWVAKFPDIKAIRGYHIPQTIAPWITATDLMQDKIKIKLKQHWENYCSLPGAVVTTPEGAKFIEDFKVGDKVFSHTLDVREVIQQHEHAFTGNIVSIYTGRSTKNPLQTVTENHPLLVRGKGWLRADEIVVGDYLCYPRKSLPEDVTQLEVDKIVPASVWVRMGDTLVSSTVRKGGRPSRPVPAVVSLDEKLCRFLGLFLAEGCTTSLTTVHHKDEQELAQLAEWGFRYFGMEPGIYDPSKYAGQAKNAVVVGNGGSNVLKELFVQLFGGTKTKKRVPPFVFRLPKKLKWAFLQGYVDGDGSIYDNGLHVDSCSPSVAYGLQTLIADLGYYAIARSKVNKLKGKEYKSTRISYTGEQGRDLVQKLGYGKLLDSSVPRDTSNAYDRGDDYFYVRVSSTVATPVKDQKVYNIGVDVDNSYLLNGVVSHNCLAMCSMGESATLNDEHFGKCYSGHESHSIRDHDTWAWVTVGIDWGTDNWAVVLGYNAVNNMPYVLNLFKVRDYEDDPMRVAREIAELIGPMQPDLIVADYGYGKAQNAHLHRVFGDKFFACNYDTGARGSRNFKPSWNDNAASVRADRTTQLKTAMQTFRDQQIGLPEHHLLPVFVKHFLNLVPRIEEDDSGLYEIIDSKGDDHFAHACSYAMLGMERLTLHETSKMLLDFM